jgi:uncharacterized protein (TIGR00251 family)
VLIELSVQPRARRTALSCEADTLKAAVTAPAESGKANAAVIELLAREWRIAKSTMEVVRGATARRKVVAIAGPVEGVARHIAGWIAQRAGEHG